MSHALSTYLLIVMLNIIIVVGVVIHNNCYNLLGTHILHIKGYL